MSFMTNEVNSITTSELLAKVRKMVGSVPGANQVLDCMCGHLERFPWKSYPQVHNYAVPAFGRSGTQLSCNERNVAFREVSACARWLLDQQKSREE